MTRYDAHFRELRRLCRENRRIREEKVELAKAEKLMKSQFAKLLFTLRKESGASVETVCDDLLMPRSAVLGAEAKLARNASIDMRASLAQYYLNQIQNTQLK